MIIEVIQGGPLISAIEPATKGAESPIKPPARHFARDG
jgi:hypothetical protein